MNAEWSEFMSTECPACHGKKRKKNGFCRACYFSLPIKLQSALWNRFGSGYEQAHNEAKDFLLSRKREAI